MEAIGTLAGGIAHDFNNILSIIFGYNELAMEEKDPKTRRHHLEELERGAKRAKELVAQILAFSRKAEQQMQPLQVSLVIKEALKMLRSSIPATIEIRQNIAADGLVLADPTQIHQIIMNLCTNAYHAMRETGGTSTKWQ
jgi:signal transduction histidine kinase